LGDAAQKLELAAGQPDQNWTAVATLGVQATRLLNDAKFDLSDRAATLSGTAADYETEEAVLALLANVPDGYSTSFDLKIEPTVPYVFNARYENGAVTVDGYVPDDETRARLATILGKGAANLERKFGMPDQNWPVAIEQAVKALELSESGAIQLSGTSLTLAAKTQDPLKEAAIQTALANLPEGYSANLLIRATIPGNPTRPVFQQIETYRLGLPIGKIAVIVIVGLLLAGLIEAHITPLLSAHP
jgi:hypothetical protein